MSCNLFFYKHIRKVSLILFCTFLSLQILFQFKTEYVKPNLHIVPPVPNQYLANAISLGDKEFYFRVLALKIQNAGDTFGRFPPLKDYDYKELYDWFTFLDTLNNKSSIIPFIASYHFSQTQKKEDTRYVIKYLDNYASRDIDLYWWWMHQAISVAQFELEDFDLALKLAYKLSESKAESAPLWTKQYPAFLHLKLNDSCSAFFVINQILSGSNDEYEISAKEMDFMRHFIESRLNKLKSEKFDPRKCQKKS
jgi:hypothetical protein